MNAALLTTAEVAELLRVHPKQVYRLIRRGMPGRRVGSDWRFVRDEVLAWMERGAGAPLPSVDAPAVERPNEAFPRPALAPLVAANGDVVVEILLELVNQHGPPLLGLVVSDREKGLALLDRRAVLAAGCHGALPPTHTGASRLCRLHLVRREVGIVGPAGRAAPRLADLAKLRVASRPRSAGMYAHLADAAREAGLPLAKLLARAVPHATHRDVVCAVLRGEADAGVVTRAWAERAGLSFRKLAVEAYGLIVHAADLGEPPLVRLCEAAQAPAFRKRLGAVPGYDPAGAGDIRYDAEPGPVDPPHGV